MPRIAFSQKKGISTLVAGFALLSGTALPAFAMGDDVEHPPFPIAGKFSHFFQSVTGLNWLSGVIAGQVASRVIRKKLDGGNVHVKVKPYNCTDLFAGKIKMINIRLDRVSVKTIPIGHLTLSSANPLWYDPGWHGRKHGLRYPMMFNLTAHLNKEDITAALNNPKVSSSIRGLKLDLPGLGGQEIQVLRPKVDLADGVMTIDARLITKGAPEDTGVPIIISGRPAIVGAKIYLRELQVSSPDIPNPEEFASFTEALFNPLFDMGRLDRKTHAVRVMQIAINPDNVEGIGTLVLAPKPEMAVAFAPSKAKSKRRGF